MATLQMQLCSGNTGWSIYHILHYHPIHITAAFMQHDYCAIDHRYTWDYLHQKIPLIHDARRHQCVAAEYATVLNSAGAAGILQNGAWARNVSCCQTGHYRGPGSARLPARRRVIWDRGDTSSL